MIIGTSGHIDHGKTSLVKAITGVDADRLKEEQRRGITIDLGFAYWPQTDGSSIGFVDVPGHESYIRNMLAGITGIDALLLVVAANEGIKPQTREHLAIASMLGITQGVVALTKSDLVEPHLGAERIAQLRQLLSETPLASAAIIPVSVITGDGMDHLKASLHGFAFNASSRREQSSYRPFRMAVDRCFTLKGAGTVLTGSVAAGTVHVDDRLMLSPSGRLVRVRGMHAQNNPALVSHPGDRAAINLAGCSKEDVHRGDVLIAPALHRPTQMLDMSLLLAASEQLPRSSSLSVHIHSGTGAWTGRLTVLSAKGGEIIGRLKLDSPAALWGQDRLVLRDASATRTIGGGMVLDINPPRRQHRQAERLHWLALLAQQGPVHALPDLVRLPPYAVCIEHHAADNAIDPGALAPVILSGNLLHLRSANFGYLFDPGVYLTIVRYLKQALGDHHERQPDQAGLSAQRLRLLLPERLHPDAFAAVVAHLRQRAEIAATGDMLRMPFHIPRLSAEHEALWTVLRPLLSGKDIYKPPRVSELALYLRRREDTVRGLLKRLARRGDVDEITADHFLLREAVAALAEAAVATAGASADGWFNAATFRDNIGIGRKMAILVLEFFDRQGLTIRKKDQRMIDARNAGLFKAG